MLAIVLDGAFLCAQAALPHLIRAGGGTIVNIGGQTGAQAAPPSRAHVVTAKAGLAGMTKALALDLAPHHITVNCVVPGTIDTCAACPARRSGRSIGATLPPIGRRGEPEEIAAWCACCAARTRATSPGRRSTSTAAAILP